jgi:hypothetical protein
MEDSKLGGVLRLIGTTLVALLAILAILVVVDVVPLEQFQQTGVKLVAVGAIVAAACGLVALLLLKKR